MLAWDIRDIDSYSNESLTEDSVEFLLTLQGFLSSFQAVGSVKYIFVLNCKME